MKKFTEYINEDKKINHLSDYIKEEQVNESQFLGMSSEIQWLIIFVIGFYGGFKILSFLKGLIKGIYNQIKMKIKNSGEETKQKGEKLAAKMFNKLSPDDKNKVKKAKEEIEELDEKDIRSLLNDLMPVYSNPSIDNIKSIPTTFKKYGVTLDPPSYI